MHNEVEPISLAHPNWGLQKIANRLLTTSLTKFEWRPWFEKRLRIAFKMPFEGVNDEKVDKIAEALRNLPPHTCMASVKTLMNAWCTSHRFHEPVLLPCIFGCKHKKDDLEHYLWCGTFKEICQAATKEIVADDLQGKIGLGDAEPTRLDFVHVACMFTTYHTIRNTYAHLLHKKMRIQEFDRINSHAFSICTVAWNDLSSCLSTSEKPQFQSLIASFSSLPSPGSRPGRA